MTIAPTELRIGNLVDTIWHHNECPSPETFLASVTVGAISDTHIVTIHHQIIDFYDDKEKTQQRIFPIKLTEEWLIRLGALEWISKDIGGYFIWHNGRKIYILFVHSLQNLYFALTGKELTLTNK